MYYVLDHTVRIKTTPYKAPLYTVPLRSRSDSERGRVAGDVERIDWGREEAVRLRDQNDVSIHRCGGRHRHHVSV